MGAAASYSFSDMPTGAAIVLAAGFFAVASLLLAPRRGIIGVALSALRFRLDLERARWLARLAIDRNATHRDPLIRLYARVSGLSDAAGRPTSMALQLAPQAARNLDLWIAAMARRPEAVPPGARFGVDSARDVLPPDLVAEIEGGAA
jgi:hypothetical protein